MDYSPLQAPLSMGIFQARILEGVAISFSRVIFLTQGMKLSLSLLHFRQILYQLSPQEALRDTLDFP